MDVPLVIIDWLRQDYSVKHSGLLRQYWKQGYRYAEGQLLEAYEGWLGRERVRMLNIYVSSLLLPDRLLLPRDQLLRHGVLPRTWLVYAVTRVGEPRREEYVPVYPRRIVPYTPPTSVIMSRLEDIMLKATGIAPIITGIIYKGAGAIEELREEREKKKAEKKRLKLLRGKRR